ncbi:MAG TPA: sodium-translocating pyrophosphatase [Lacipirellulaceae bacterium]|nr:sodium-translocating pyrophosphatase [Lacipirellulaceae bacterium]
MIRTLFRSGAALLLALLCVSTASASEAELVLPDFSQGPTFLGVSGRSLLLVGLVVCLIGAGFGLVVFNRLRNLPVHKSMRDVSELIYQTCKTYLLTQGKFLLLLECFIGVVMVIYFGWLRGSEFGASQVAIIVGFSVIGILGSYGVAWFGIRINTYANSRAAFASLAGKPYPVYAIPVQAGISIGTLLISVELAMMLIILLFVPGNYAGPCFIGFAIGESLGAAALRIAGGIFTKIADIGADLMKIVFKIEEDDARNPGVIADCTGDNAGDSVGPTADGFETYGVTGVALIVFIMLAITPLHLPAGVSVKTATADQLLAAQAAAAPIEIKLLVWIFVMRILMIVTSIVAYVINERTAKVRYENADHMDYEKPLTSLVWLTSIISVAMTYIASILLIRDLGDGSLWWKLATIITCGTLAGAIIPELVKIFTSVNSSHVKEIVASSKEGGASLNILSGLTAGNFSAFWMGLVIAGLMGIAYGVAVSGGASGAGSLGALMVAPSVFAFGLVAFGFLGMGPVTIAVDSYGPVADNAQSIFELSTLASQPNAPREIRDEFGFEPDFESGKRFLEENDGAGNTFKATAKPVLIGTAVVGATTLIFSIIMLLTDGLTNVAAQMNLSLLYPPFVLGLVTGGAVIYWFTGASTQAVVTGAYRAVEFIKTHIHLDSAAKSASSDDSKRVVAICTQYAQRGMLNIFLAVFFVTLAFACLNEYFFIGYLISIAVFGLYQAIFMANAGGAWDNAKKIVEVNLREKGTSLHDATVVGDTVGDPFKDTSSVALNPIIKFTTLFGLLAVELAIHVSPGWRIVWTIVLFAAALAFVWQSFYGMRISRA